MSEFNGYQLSRAWWNFCFKNPEKIKPKHTAIYFFAIEHCNRLGWKEKFGFPSQMAMEAVGIKNWKSYSEALSDIVKWKFIVMIEISKNQYSSNIIALCAPVKNAEALPEALDIALSNHHKEQSIKHSDSTVSIDKQITKEQITINKEQLGETSPPPPPVKFNFKKTLLEYPFKKQLVDDWMIVRKNKKAANTETAYNSFIKQLELCCAFHKHDADTVFKVVVESGWQSVKKHWYDNYLADLAKNNPNAPQQKTSLSTGVSHLLKKS